MKSYTIITLITLLLIHELAVAQYVFDRPYLFGTDSRGFSILELPGQGYYVVGCNDSLSFDSLTGQPETDYWQGIIMKLDYNGDTLKTFQIGNEDTMYAYLYASNSDDFFRTAIMMDDGNILVAGETQSYNAENYYDYDLWLIKFDSDLNLLWNKQFSVSDTALGMNYATGKKTSNGGILLPGLQQDFITFVDRFRISVFDSSGNIRINKELLPNLSGTFLGACETSDGGYMAAGLLYNVIQNSNLSPIIVKTDSAGNVDWYHVLPYSGDRHGADDVMATGDGNYIYTWYNVVWQSGAKKVWIPHLTKIDIYGNEIWTKDYEYSFDMLRRIKELPNGNIMITGWYADTIGNGRQALLKLFDPNGNTLWTRKFSGPSGPAPGDFVIPMDGTYTSDGGFLLTGLTSCCSFVPNLGWTGTIWAMKTDSLGLITSVSNLPEPGFQGASIGLIYPNPTSGLLTVSSLLPPISEHSGMGEKGAYLLVFDMQGRQLRKTEVGTGLNHTQLDLSSYSPGEYVLILAIDGFNAGSKRIIIQK